MSPTIRFVKTREVVGTSAQRESAEAFSTRIAPFAGRDRKRSPV